MWLLYVLTLLDFDTQTSFEFLVDSGSDEDGFSPTAEYARLNELSIVLVNSVYPFK